MSIPEQFTVKAHPALFDEEEEEGSQKKVALLIIIPVYNSHTHSKRSNKLRRLALCVFNN